MSSGFPIGDIDEASLHDIVLRDEDVRANCTQLILSSLNKINIKSYLKESR